VTSPSAVYKDRQCNQALALQIALHVASTYGGAQFYIGCAQVNVVNGGNGNPGPLVSIPGVYTGVSVELLNAALGRS
jgi:hypothetical protein